MWARSVAAGVPDDLYWHLTPADTRVLIEELGERRKADQDAANLRAGVVAATIANIWRKKGSRAIRPQDFFRRRKPMSAGNFRTMMLTWAKDMQASGRSVAISTREVEA